MPHIKLEPWSHWTRQGSHSCNANSVEASTFSLVLFVLKNNIWVHWIPLIPLVHADKVALSLRHCSVPLWVLAMKEWSYDSPLSLPLIEPNSSTTGNMHEVDSTTSYQVLIALSSLVVSASFLLAIDWITTHAGTRKGGTHCLQKWPFYLPDHFLGLELCPGLGVKVIPPLWEGQAPGHTVDRYYAAVHLCCQAPPSATSLLHWLTPWKNTGHLLRSATGKHQCLGV